MEQERRGNLQAGKRRCARHVKAVNVTIGRLKDAMHVTPFGFKTPGPLLRRWAVSFWSRTIRNELRIAIVARPEHICPETTGLLVAAEEVLLANTFEVERDAVAWLDEIARGRRAEGSAVNASNAGSREACTRRS